MMALKIDDGVVLSGYQKKLKTMKKKFFVLYMETSSNAARLEYFDNEKKFKQRSEPKRVIYLKNCFNINRRNDTKYKFVLGLSSREGLFGIVFDSESDLKKWLDSLLSLQRGNANISDQVYQPFDHIWQVVVQKKGISEKHGIIGNYHCCLTSKSLTFICIGPEKQSNGDERKDKVEILLTTVRRCGHAAPQDIFYMELGRQSVLGSGDLWMETEDAAVARNMHDTILNAMSAKTEPNMNLINVNNSTITQEPMRKRSSSATEASKPINVLQKRQIPIEIRNSISPHNSSYGRERCDSLPTRNRTLSECSNQSYQTSNHAFRSNTISGFRPISCQRHSNSPPLSTPMRCSESEESSISIDETDDNGSYQTYRFNSRSSKGIIPEENIDDIADNKCSKPASINGENMDNYIPMTPIKSTNEIINAVHQQTNQFKQIFLTEKLQSTELSNLFEAESEKLRFDFPEHTCERLRHDSDVDVENQCERPTRAYSIGSKSDHTKVNKILGNLNEVNSPRVRAFSVGSRSKIPRCDLQRGFLFSKIRKDTLGDGSNSNVSTDLPTCNEIISFNSPREKKSTSAPLLNHKGQVIADRMSDLMEIDFSKIVAQNQTQTQTPAAIKATLVKSGSVQIPNTLRNNNKLNVQMPTPLNGGETAPSKRTLSTASSSSEGGYLEMKPVGNSSSSQLIDDTNRDTKNVSLSQQQSHPQKTLIYINKTRVVDPNVAESPPNNLIPLRVETANIKNSITKSLLGLSKKEIDSNLNNETKSKNLENKIQNMVLNTTASPAASTDERKLTHSISNEDYTLSLNKSIGETAEAGYKILQIKSDSSLISNRKIQRPSIKEQRFEHSQKPKLLESRVQFSTPTRSNVSSPTPDTPPSTLTPSPVYKSNSSVVVGATTTTTISPNTHKDSLNNASSRPPSVTSEHELHYASLDLPQCSGQIVSSALNRSDMGESSPPVLALSSNSYAKIDFDHSDSSSSSSKVCNV